MLGAAGWYWLTVNGYEWLFGTFRDLLGRDPRTQSKLDCNIFNENQMCFFVIMAFCPSFPSAFCWARVSIPLGTRSRSCQLDEMSLQSFEIAGGEPAQDEFQSQGNLDLD